MLIIDAITRLRSARHTSVNKKNIKKCIKEYFSCLARSKSVDINGP